MNLPTKVDACRKKEIIDVINDNGCSWINRITAYYIAIGNDFYHKSQDCFTIKGLNTSTCDEEEASDGRKKCKFCNKE